MLFILSLIVQLYCSLFLNYNFLDCEEQTKKYKDQNINVKCNLVIDIIDID
jgi:hypothetical protein